MGRILHEGKVNVTGSSAVCCSSYTDVVIDFFAVYIAVVTQPQNGQKLLFPLMRSSPYLTYVVPWVHPPKQHLDLFIRVAGFMNVTIRQTDTQTDHVTASVAVGRIWLYSVMWPKINLSFVVTIQFHNRSAVYELSTRQYVCICSVDT